MIIDNDPQITRNISIPRDLSSLSCSAFTAGIVEAALDGLGFVSVSHSSKRIFIREKAWPSDCTQYAGDGDA